MGPGEFLPGPELTREWPDDALAGDVAFEEDMGDGFEVVAGVTVGSMFVGWDVQPVASAAKSLVEVLP